MKWCRGTAIAEIYLIVGVLLLSIPTSASEQRFAKAVTYDAGISGPMALKIADVNDDGRPDIVVTGGNQVGVLLNNGNGTFQTSQIYNAGGFGMQSVAIRDLNGDQMPDIVLAGCARADCSGDGVVAILLNNGDGTFAAPVTYDSGGQNPSSVRIDDLNHDGIPDLTVSNWCSITGCSTGNDGEVSVLLGIGGGAFKLAVSYAKADGLLPRPISQTSTTTAIQTLLCRIGV